MAAALPLYPPPRRAKALPVAELSAVRHIRSEIAVEDEWVTRSPWFAASRLVSGPENDVAEYDWIAHHVANNPPAEVDPVNRGAWKRAILVVAARICERGPRTGDGEKNPRALLSSLWHAKPALIEALRRTW
mgnify:CR=1 FL=1